jgi:hypothetical protein
VKIFLFSGSGNGSGKSSAAKLMTQDVWSLANGIRDDLTSRYPRYNWHNKSQVYKDTTIIEEYEIGNKSMRQVMIEYGQLRCKNNPTYWADLLVSYLKNRHFIADGTSIIGVDDIRKVCELETIRAAFPNSTTHFHLTTPIGIAKVEPEFENEQLALLADYRMTWSK